MTNGILNECDMAQVPELLFAQPRLGGGNGAQGINGTLTNHFFSGPADATQAKDLPAGTNPFLAATDMILAPITIKEPSWLPVGLNNGVYHEIDEAAGRG